MKNNTKNKLIRITTVPLSLEKLLEGQLRFMNDFFEVRAISAEKNRLELYGAAEGVKTFYLRLTRKITPLKDILAVYRLYIFLRKEKPKIVHTHTPKAGIVGMMAAYLARVPIRLHTVAGLPVMETKGLRRTLLTFVEKLTYKLATKVYPNSLSLQNIIISEKFTKAEKLEVIANGSSNGIDLTYFNPVLFSEATVIESKEKWKIPLNDYIFIFVGRLVGDKGINELVTAFTECLKSNPHITLVLVGPLEPQLDPLKSETLAEIEHNAKIIATDYQEDVRPFFAMSDCLVFPSYREGFPNVVLQAGAMGLPAIVTDINGSNEIIKHQENGLIVPKKDTNALTCAMEQLLSEIEQWRIPNTYRRHIETNYPREKVWQALLTEYQELIKHVP